MAGNIALFVLIAFIYCCTHQGTNSRIIKNETVMFHQKIPGIYRPEQYLDLPTELVSMAEVTRQTAPLRFGPSSVSQIKDQILIRGDRVLVLGKHDPWIKVYSLTKKTKGWLHKKVLRNPEQTYSLLKIRADALELGFVRFQHQKAFDYGDERELNVKIPEGTPLQILKQGEDRILVLIPETDSVLWLEKESVW